MLLARTAVPSCTSIFGAASPLRSKKLRSCGIGTRESTETRCVRSANSAVTGRTSGSIFEFRAHRGIVTHMTNAAQRNDLVKLLASLRAEGAELSAPLLDLHESLCEQQRDAYARVERLEQRLNEARVQAEQTAEELSVGAFELHLPSAFELSQSRRKKIVELGGNYSECRGYSDTRFVAIPNSALGRELAATLLNEASAPYCEGGKPHKITCVFRPIGRCSDNVVYHVAWTADYLSNAIHQCNLKGLANHIAEITRELSQARENL